MKTGDNIPEPVLPPLDQQSLAIEWLLHALQTNGVIQVNDPIRLTVALLAQDAQDFAKSLLQQETHAVTAAVESSMDAKVATLFVHMKPSECSPGWMTYLSDLGCKATYHSAPFGRKEWLIKKGAEWIVVNQGKNGNVITAIKNPTPVQREIAQSLAEVCIASLQEDGHKNTFNPFDARSDESAQAAADTLVRCMT